MRQSGFSKLFLGFLFIMFDFRFNSFDILPDVLGYVFFAIGFSILEVNSPHFTKAKNLNILMIALSAVSVFESFVSANVFGPLGTIVGIAGLVVGLLVVYHLFMGTKEMAEKQQQMDIYQESNQRWNQYLFLQFAVFLSLILVAIPPLAVIYMFALFVVNIVFAIMIMAFMKKCEERLEGYE